MANMAQVNELPGSAIEKGVKGVKKFQKMPPDTPVLPSLYTTMKTELLVNDGNIATVFHSKPLPQQIWWAEYDVDLSQMYFVTVKAKILGLGMRIWDPIHTQLQHAKLASLIKVQHKPFLIPEASWDDVSIVVDVNALIKQVREAVEGIV